MTRTMAIRPAQAAEVAALARLWYDGWQDAHAGILPRALAEARTLESFEERLGAALSDVRVAGPYGAPLGLAVTKGDELYQFYVAAAARGTGLAATLIADAEARLAEAGVETAWLACAIGNRRAARFYEKRGWRREGTFVNRLDTPTGPYELEVWRFAKRLGRDRGQAG